MSSRCWPRSSGTAPRRRRGRRGRRRRAPRGRPRARSPHGGRADAGGQKRRLHSPRAVLITCKGQRWSRRSSALGSRGMALDPARTVAELEELRTLTGDESGAQRVAWTETWERARAWLRDLAAETGAVEEIDEAGNQWFTLRGRSDKALLIGGHIDSVSNGGWLDGSLNVLAGLEVVRRIASDGEPPVTVRLVNWADEEGARFGRSLFGSSAAAGSMRDQDELRALRDLDGVPLPQALS